MLSLGKRTHAEVVSLIVVSFGTIVAANILVIYTKTWERIIAVNVICVWLMLYTAKHFKFPGKTKPKHDTNIQFDLSRIRF